LLYARTGSKDGDGRANLSPIILGNFDGSNFNPIEEQELDFGAGSFGFQVNSEQNFGFPHSFSSKIK